MQDNEKYSIFNFENTPEMILGKLRKLPSEDIFFIVHMFSSVIKEIEADLEKLKESNEKSNQSENSYEYLMYMLSIMNSGQKLSSEAFMEMTGKFCEPNN